MERRMIDGHMHIAQWEDEQGRSVFENLRNYQKENGIIAADNMCCTSNGRLWAGFETQLYNPGIRDTIKAALHH